MNDSVPAVGRLSPANGVAVPIFGENRPPVPPVPISAKNRQPKTIGDLSEHLARFDSQLARVPVDDSLRIEGQSLHVGGVALKLDLAGVERLCEQMRLPYHYLAGLDERRGPGC